MTHPAQPRFWRRVKELLQSALGRDLAERSGFLDEACEDPAIRREVESLLGVEDRGFLDEPAVELDPPDPQGLIGRRLSHYAVLEEVGRGGMGIVYRALDVNLVREVAIKVLPPELVSHPERKERFVREARAAAALEHPSIARVHEIDEAGGSIFIVMELVRGGKLSDLLERETPSVARALDILSQVAEALSCAHEHGVVHRDLKPSNIMITESGRVKIIDFGLAKLLEEAGEGNVGVSGVFKEDVSKRRSRTHTGQLMGTLDYMSPEQSRGQKVDLRSDLYSLGVVTYELLTGNPPLRRRATTSKRARSGRSCTNVWSRRWPIAIRALTRSSPIFTG